jgi:hypothetical protein
VISDLFRHVDTDPPRDVAAMRAVFERALHRHPSEVRSATYVFAGRSARLRIVGADLARELVRPLSHLETVPGCAPDLSIDLWDESATGEARPHCDAEGERAWQLGIGHLVSAGGGRWVGYRRAASAAWLDRGAQSIVGALRRDELSPYEHGKPLHLLLTFWHRDRGAPLFHAGMIAHEGRGVLLPGWGGSGKSTTSLACARGGFRYLADDYVALERRGDGVFVAHSLYSSIWLAGDHVERFPELRGHTHRGERKLFAFLSEVFPAALAASAEVRALVLPRVAPDRSTRIYPMSHAEALRIAGPSSLLELVPRPGRRELDHIARLIEQVPCFALDVGGDLDQIPARVREVLESVHG